MQLLLVSLIISFLLAPSDLLPSEAHDTDQVSLYRPNYFIFDGNRDAKFQISYRIRLLKISNWVDLFVSHTHKAFWAITSENSAPFREHNLNPEIYFRWDNPELGIPLKHFQAGFEHESTGVAGDQSRSWNRLSGQIEWEFFTEGKKRKGHLHTHVRGWIIVDKDEELNPDIDEFIGSWELNAGYILHERLKFGGEIAMTLRKRSIMMDYGVKIPHVDFFFYLQYWKGRGEWLVNYKEKTDTFRFGLKFFVK